MSQRQKRVGNMNELSDSRQVSPTQEHCCEWKVRIDCLFEALMNGADVMFSLTDFN